MLIEKRPGAPSGTLTVSVAGGSYVFDDAANAQVDIPTKQAALLVTHPFLRQVGGSANFTPTTIESYTYSSGRLATMTSDGVTATFTYNAGGQISSIAWSTGSVETWNYDGNANLISVTTT